MPLAEATIDRLVRLAAALRLDGVEPALCYGTPGLRVRGKFLARMKDAATLVIRCPAEEKAILMEADPACYFQTEHYAGYDALLIRLAAIADADLGARLERAWLMQAGKRLIAARARG